MQVERWIHQYRTFQTQSIPVVDRLIDWLLLHLPKDHSTTLVHGDFRYTLAYTLSLSVMYTPHFTTPHIQCNLCLSCHHVVYLTSPVSRLSNLVFHPERAEVVGVLDWGSAVLGDPLLDITSLSLTHHLPQDHPLFPGAVSDCQQHVLVWHACLVPIFIGLLVVCDDCHIGISSFLFSLQVWEA